jgi:hypothetical protein
MNKYLIVLALGAALAAPAFAGDMEGAKEWAGRMQRCLNDGMDYDFCTGLTSEKQEKLCNTSGRRTPSGGCAYVPKPPKRELFELDSEAAERCSELAEYTTAKEKLAWQRCLKAKPKPQGRLFFLNPTSCEIQLVAFPKVESWISPRILNKIDAPSSFWLGSSTPLAHLGEHEEERTHRGHRTAIGEPGDCRRYRWRLPEPIRC